MALRPQQAGYAYAAGACYTQYGYQRQDDYYSKLGYTQQQGYCSDNAHYNGGSSMQQMKPDPNMATLPQPSKPREVGYQGYYGQHNNGWNGNHQSYPNYPNGQSYPNYPNGQSHPNYPNGQSYPNYPNGPNTYQAMSYSYYAQGHYPPYY